MRSVRIRLFLLEEERGSFNAEVAEGERGGRRDEMELLEFGIGALADAWCLVPNAFPLSAH